MKIKYIHIVLVLLFLIASTLPTKAQIGVEENVWDDVDFTDTALVASESFQNRMLEQLFNLTESGDMHRFDSLSMATIGNLLEKAKVNMRVYEYILEFMLNGYSNFGREQVVDYLLNYPMLFEGEVQVEEGMRLDSITEPYQKVRVGAKAPDVSGITIDGRPYRLYDSKAEKVIVVFWSTDCEYCHDFMVAIRKNLDLKFDFELVTFALAEDESDAIRSVKKMRLDGYHFYDDLRWECKPFLDYHITSTPTVFVLDKDRMIVCKPYDWYELKEWLK